MWIRSQNKMNLIDITSKSLNVCRTTTISNEYSICIDCMVNVLGTYATEQRAIQVLDSIQKEIVDLTGISYRKTDTDSGLTKTEYSEAVFQMPEK